MSEQDRFWVQNGDRVVMLDLGEVVAFDATSQQGVVRHIPGGRTVQDPSTWRVEVQLRGGHTITYTLSPDVYAALMKRMGVEVTP